MSSRWCVTSRVGCALVGKPAIEQLSRAHLSEEDMDEPMREREGSEILSDL